jgi:hypothetical protein
LKGLGATVAAATTGVPTGAGKKQDPLKNMLNQLKKLDAKSGAQQALVRELRRPPTDYNKYISRKVIQSFLKNKSITQNFANKISNLLNKAPNERKAFITEFDSKEDTRSKKVNTIRNKAIEYTKKNKIPVVVNANGTTRPLDLKAGEEVVYKKIPNHPHNAVMANITSAAYRKKQKQKQQTRVGRVGSGGGSRGADGIIRGLGSDFDELFTRNRFGNTDYRKGGLFRKNK